jgi:hypothetical protein
MISQSSPNDLEHIAAVAIRFPDGRVFEDCTHFGAMFAAFHAGAFPPCKPKTTKGWNTFMKFVDDMKLTSKYRLEEGFTTNSGRFVGRDEAFRIAERARQLKELPNSHSDVWLSSHELVCL